MQLRYSYRLYPGAAQREALARAFGCARVVFNDALAARKAAHEAGEPYPTDAAMSARLTESKETPERAWLGEVSSVVLQQALADLNTVYRNFFASVTGKRKGPKIAPPRFRSRKDRRQAKSVHDAGWSSFVNMLEYKAKLYGREFRKIGRFEPTSQVCSACGARDGPKPLSVRTWTYAKCGTVHDRDVNAAKNIAALGRREAQNARGGQVRPAATPAQASEAGSRRGAV